MTRHTERLARRQAATDELQARITARQAAFDALDVVDRHLENVAAAAAGDDDQLTRAERTITAVDRLNSSIDELRARAEALRATEGRTTKPAEIATILGVPEKRLFPKAAPTRAVLPPPVSPPIVD